MTIDWSFRIADLIPAAAFLIAGLSVIFMMKSDVRNLGTKLGFLKETVDKQRQEDRSCSDVADLADEVGEVGQLLL